MYMRLLYSISSLFDYIVYFCYWFLFCNILSPLGQTTFPVCGTLKDFWFCFWFVYKEPCIFAPSTLKLSAVNECCTRDLVTINCRPGVKVKAGCRHLLTVSNWQEKKRGHSAEGKQLSDKLSDNHLTSLIVQIKISVSLCLSSRLMWYINAVDVSNCSVHWDLHSLSSNELSGPQPGPQHSSSCLLRHVRADQSDQQTRLSGSRVLKRHEAKWSVQLRCCSNGQYMKNVKCEHWSV